MTVDYLGVIATLSSSELNKFRLYRRKYNISNGAITSF